MTGRERARCALAMHEAALRAAVGQHGCLLLHEIVRDLVVDLAARGRLLERPLHAAHDHVAIGDRVVFGSVVMRPVLGAQRLVGPQQDSTRRFFGRPRNSAPA